LTGKENEPHRRKLAAQFVQRKRGDIRRYLETDTPFPTREGGDLEETYKLSDDYKRLFERVLKYAREIVMDPADGNQHRQRVQWWSARLRLTRVESGGCSRDIAHAAAVRIPNGR
jgi:hypothetical protein